jgi:outer membrane protein TolC
VRHHLLAASLLLAVATRASAQPPPTLTLEQALQYAAEHYPSIRAALEQVNADAAGVRVARAAYLPRLDSVWQSLRGTTNNVFGQLLPQSVIPSISGPVLPAANGSVWGTGAGAMFSWEAVDFGLRDAQVAGAEAALAHARADEALTRLQVQAAVGEAFLTVVAAERRVTTAQADVERREVLGRAVHALVENQLRAGADASRVDAETAAARTRLIQARETDAIARASLARLLGAADVPLAIDVAPLLDRMPGAPSPSGNVADHPLTKVREAAREQARAAQAVLARTDRPRLFLQSSLFARGTGASPDGHLDGGWRGLGFDRANWSAGLMLTFPNLFDAASLRARKDLAAATERADTARYDESVLTIVNERRAAGVRVEAARAIAANTPLQLAAARDSESQARARYQAGLTTLTEVADAQSLLAQAEADDQVARAAVWRALLGAAIAGGDLSPFVTALRAAAEGR